MSGTINYLSLVTGAASGSSNTVGTLLGIIEGNGATSAATASSPAASLNALQAAERTQTADIASTAAEPQVARDIAAFTSAVAAAKTPAELLNNPTALKVILTANGLGSEVSYTALAQKALLSNVNSSASLANQLSSSNSAWLSAAKTYNFANQGLSVIQTPSVISTIANAYAEVTWRSSLDQATPGLSNALTFRAEASGITSVNQILGDPVLRDVVTTALGLPLQIALQPLEAQDKAISSRLDISQFQSPSFTESFIQRYLISKASSSTTGSTASSSMTSLLA